MEKPKTRAISTTRALSSVHVSRPAQVGGMCDDPGSEPHRSNDQGHDRAMRPSPSAVWTWQPKSTCSRGADLEALTDGEMEPMSLSKCQGLRVPYSVPGCDSTACRAPA
jgi:hypothetical protein